MHLDNERHLESKKLNYFKGTKSKWRFVAFCFLPD